MIIFYRFLGWILEAWYFIKEGFTYGTYYSRRLLGENWR